MFWLRNRKIFFNFALIPRGHNGTSESETE